MRILVATDQWFPDFRGGAARVATETARGLAERGHEVTVLAPAGAGLREEESDGRLLVLRRLPRGRLPQTLSDAIGVRRVAGRLDGTYDVMVAHQVTVGCGLASARKGVPLVLVYHGSPVREARLDAHELSFGKRQAGRLGAALLLAALEGFVVRRAQRIIVLSEYMRGLVARDHPDASQRLRVARGGVDRMWCLDEPDHELARELLGISRDEPLVLAVRRLELGLGLDALLRAFGSLLETRPAKLVIVGGGSLDRHLRRLVDDLGLHDSVRFAGPKDGAELRRWYTAADLFVLPPKPLEGFGMATLEALASGTPAVAARVGANPEILAPLDERLIAESATPGDLARTMATTLDISGVDLRARCRAYAASSFVWDRVLPSWEAVLKAAADGA